MIVLIEGDLEGVLDDVSCTHIHTTGVGLYTSLGNIKVRLHRICIASLAATRAGY